MASLQNTQHFNSSLKLIIHLSSSYSKSLDNTMWDLKGISVWEMESVYFEFSKKSYYYILTHNRGKIHSEYLDTEWGQWVFRVAVFVHCDKLTG